MYPWIFTALDGTEWIIRAASEQQAKTGAYCAEKKRTDSIAAATLAANTVKRY